jgi:catechol 2,3-dioxygenase-like lactoylglutathione lyase family enzyme
MPQSLAHIARDYDEAIAWLTGVLGFTLVADEYQPEQDKRWVLVAPPGARENAATLLLARACSREQAASIENREEATQRHSRRRPGPLPVFPAPSPNPFECRVWPGMAARC